MPASDDYLKLRGRTYYVRYQIPQHLWTAAGRREYVKTLKTRDRDEANRRKHALIAIFQQRVKALERQKPNDPREDLIERALSLRADLERYKGRVIVDGEEGQPLWTYEDELLSQISDEAKEFAETHGDEAATSFFKIAKGEGTPLRPELVDTWLAEQGDAITGQTRAQHRTAVDAFLGWAGESVLVENANRRKAGEFVSHLLAPTSGLSRKTVKRYLSSLSSLWKWLMARGIANSNPWLGHGVGKKPKRGEAPKRRQWTDAALKTLLSAQHTPRYTAVLHDLVRLALVAGARLDELCALKTRDIHQREDGWWIIIREGKTEAAVREVPIHDSAVHVFLRRRKSSDGFLFEGLLPGGPDKKRSWNVSKAFGHYTKKLGLGEDRQVFHALRNTFVEAMEAAEVPESTTKLIVGHKRPSLTYGLYSKGERVKLRKHINKLRYGGDVMKLIASTSDKPQKHTSRRKPSAAR
jgi:integrase